jgi:hypothetical protein
MTIALQVMELSGSDLGRVPESERVLLIQLGHLQNTINFLYRWLLSSQIKGKNGADFHAALAQHNLAARTLAGVLCEGWAILESSYFGAKVSQQYASELSMDGSAALEKLKQYFSHSNLLKTVRDRFAFHFDRKEVLRQLQVFRDSDTSLLYISEEVGNSLYYLSETVVGLSLLSALGNAVDRDTMQAINDRLHDDVLLMAAAFGHFIGDYLGIVVTKHISADRWDKTKVVNLTVPASDCLDLPFFVSQPEAKEGA